MHSGIKGGDLAASGGIAIPGAGGTLATAVNGQKEAVAAGGQPPRKRHGAMPIGGFISHLLEADNKLIGRHFSDLEVALLQPVPPLCAPIGERGLPARSG